jgi:hypothetical protein
MPATRPIKLVFDGGPTIETTATGDAHRFRLPERPAAGESPVGGVRYLWHAVVKGD